ncbi:MAG: ParB/RepB/Spo0J family partition protein, partial [Ardenticatenaceae bacterium]
LQLPAPVQELVRQGSLAEGHARALLALPSASAMMEAAERFVKRGYTVRQAEDWVKRALSPTPTDGGQESDLSLHDHDLQRQFATALGTKVELRRRKHGGQLVIYFENEEDLQALYDMLLAE